MINLFANASGAFPLGLGFGTFVFGALIIFIWWIVAIILKGYALWHAAKRDEKPWFIVLLIINTMGILELIYLIFIVKKWSKKDTVPPPSAPVPPVTPSAQ